MIKIRLARGGRKKAPYYYVVVSNARSPRDGRFIEKLGTYNPMLEKGHADRVRLRKDKIDYWLSQGAIPTERISYLLKSDYTDISKGNTTGNDAAKAS